MKILRTKLFFDYKSYAKKYGQEEANKLADIRREAAKKALSEHKKVIAEREWLKENANKGVKERLKHQIKEDLHIDKAKEYIQKAKESDKNNQTIIDNAVNWIKQNPKKAAAIGTTGAAITIGGIALNAHSKKRGKEKKEFWKEDSSKKNK